MNGTALQRYRVDMLFPFLYFLLMCSQQAVGGGMVWCVVGLSLEATCPDPAIWNRDQSAGP